MITQPEPLELFVTVTNVNCPNSTQGSIAVSAQEEHQITASCGLTARMSTRSLD